MSRLPSFLIALAIALGSAPQPSLADDDWGAVRDPFDQKVIAIHKGILARNPHDPGSLAKLLEMYGRYRTVDLLRDEYAKVLAKNPNDWAALVVLGHLFHKTGDVPRALEHWTRAVGARDADAPSWLAIGELHKAANRPKEARAAYDKGLAHATTKDSRKRALRALADLALAQGDTDGANAYFKQFLELDPNNAQLWIERGDAMLAAGKREIALESYAAAEKLLGTDPAKRVEVVARRGQTLQGMGKLDEAALEYQRAIKLAPKGYYLEVELTDRIIEIHRTKQNLPGLLAQYEKLWAEGARGHFEWATLGKLYKETGAQDKAIAAFRRAVAKAPWELDTQDTLIKLLENSGRDDEALAQYEAVVRAAPGEARFQLSLADRYQRRGQEKKALDVLARLQVRFPSDPGVISAIADAYQRWGKEDLAIAQFERLARLEPDDLDHLVTLGEQYWQKNDKQRALATWKRLVASGKAAGFARLGAVLGEHGQGYSAEALANFAKAIKLDDKNPDYYKGRAGVYEGMKQYADAVIDWEHVLALVGTRPSDRMARREARKKLVGIITRWGAKEQQYKRRWTETFKDGAAGGDLEAGYFLVEYYTKVGRAERGQPERVLEQLHRRVPDDQELALDLVKAYRNGRKLDEAVAVLLELAKAVPSREREMYNTIADIKIEARKDDEANEWRMKAVAKDPRDPDGYEKMAEGYVAMQRWPDAIGAYEKVLQLAPRNARAQFALAQLHIQNGTPAKAAELLRGVLRTAGSDEEVARAAREAIALEEMTDTLGELEKVLSPLSYMMAHKPIYRRVLVDLYLRYVPRLVERERHGNDEVKKAARAELQRISGHGLQPLLEALRDEKDLGQQRVAVNVLGQLGNKGAAAPLVHLARHEPTKEPRHIGTLAESPDHELRIEALVAAGRLGDPRVLDDVLPLMDHLELPMREAAAFTIGRAQDRRAVPALLRALADRRPSVQTLACLGLAQIDDARGTAAMAATLLDARRDDATRAACAYGIGARKATSGTQALTAALGDNRGEAQRLAAWALGQIGDPRALGALVRAYFARAGRSSDELIWAIGRVSGAGLAPAPQDGLDEYPLTRGKYDPVLAVAALPGDLPHPPIPTKLVADHADDIARGLLEALGEHRDVVVSVLADLDGAPDQISLGALSPPALDGKLGAAYARIAEQIAPAVAAQLTSEDPKVRALAISVTAKLDGGKLRGADAAIEKALADPADQVRAAAMSAIPVLARRRGRAPAELVALLGKTLVTAAWADRRAAALALGKLGPSGDPALLVKAGTDSSSFVREAVAQALGAISGAPGALEAELKLSADEVAQVRVAAVTSLAAFPDARAARRRAELAAGDPDPSVRAAAR
jgi:cellulose synthase operon protein C